MDGEDALHAVAIGNLAHGEVLVDPAPGASDAYALIGLHAGALALDHLDVDAHGVAGTEIGDLPLLGKCRSLLLLELLDDVHGINLSQGACLGRESLSANAILFDCSFSRETPAENRACRVS